MLRHRPPRGVISRASGDGAWRAWRAATELALADSSARSPAVGCSRRRAVRSLAVARRRVCRLPWAEPAKVDLDLALRKIRQLLNAHCVVSEAGGGLKRSPAPRRPGRRIPCHPR